MAIRRWKKFVGLLLDFNKVNNDLLGLADFNKVDQLFLKRSRRFWWKHIVAEHYKISPMEVVQWDTEEILESLARIADLEAEAEKKKNRRIRN